MHPKLEKIFNEASLEFWAQLDDGMNEQFGEIARDYCEGQSDNEEQVRFIVAEFSQWKAGGK